jgi:hypothetical protein
MGMIFRQVAQISPLEAPGIASTIGGSATSTKSSESSRYGSPKRDRKGTVGVEGL